jgi:hypothetical protein
MVLKIPSANRRKREAEVRVIPRYPVPMSDFHDGYPWRGVWFVGAAHRVGVKV